MGLRGSGPEPGQGKWKWKGKGKGKVPGHAGSPPTAPGEAPTGPVTGLQGGAAAEILDVLAPQGRPVSRGRVPAGTVRAGSMAYAAKVLSLGVSAVAGHGNGR